MLSWRIALHFICKKNSNVPSFTSLVAILGVAFGVCAFLVVITILNSFQKEMKHIIATINPHIILYSAEGVGAPSSLQEEIQKKYESHLQKVSPFLYMESIASVGHHSASLYIRAIEGEDSASASDLSTLITPHNALSALNTPAPKGTLPSLILGGEAARQLGVKPGDTLSLMVFRMGEDGGGGMVSQSVRVVGLVNVGIAQYDAHYALMNLSEGQRFFSLPGFVSGLEIKLTDPDDAPEISSALTQDTHYSALAWENIDRALFSQISRDSTAIKLIVLMISFVSGFNIIVTLSLTVIDRRAQISLLRSLGAQKKHILRIFVCCGVILGGSGALLGALCGVILLKICAGIHLGDFQQFYYFETIPVEYNVLLIGLSVVSALLLSVCSALYPAYKATSIAPLAGLRSAP